MPAVFLTCFGLISVFSASLVNHDFLSIERQLIVFVLSLGLAIFLSFSDLRFLRANGYLVFALYLFSLAILAGLLFLGSTIRGVRGWYKIGPVSFAPVSISTLILIIVLSKYFSSRHIELARFQPILFSGIYGLLPILLVFFEPDLGSALGLIAVWLGSVIFSGIRLRHFLILILISLILFSLSWQFWLKGYQKQRIFSFLNPKIDEHGVSWNVNQSKIAIGSGGLLGKGFGRGSQTQYGFLPEAKTDFIFSAIAEEAGFIGVLSILAAFMFLFWRILRVAFSASDNFTRLFAAGAAFYLLSQIFINIGMCLGLMPVIGIPLPFVSYGGSNLLACYLMLGLLAGLKRRI